ncbi:MAG: acyl-CoA dehydrogenase family protein [Marmoricola sp.]
MSTAGNERGLSLRSPGRFCATADRLVKLWKQHGAPAEHRDAVVSAWKGAEAYRLYTWATVSRLLDGGQIGYAGSVNKVFWSNLDVAMHETALDILGSTSELRDGEHAAWMDGYLFSLSGPIYAGTNEVQRASLPNASCLCPASRREPDHGFPAYRRTTGLRQGPL